MIHPAIFLIWFALIMCVLIQIYIGFTMCRLAWQGHKDASWHMFWFMYHTVLTIAFIEHIEKLGIL